MNFNKLFHCFVIEKLGVSKDIGQRTFEAKTIMLVHNVNSLRAGHVQSMILEIVAN